MNADTSSCIVDRLTGRPVTLLDPKRMQAPFNKPTRALEVSTCEWQGRTIQHVCELPDGTRVKVLPSWVTPAATAANVVRLHDRR